MHYNGTSSHQTAINVNDSLGISSHDEMHPRAYYACFFNKFSTYGKNSGAFETKSEIYAFQNDMVLFHSFAPNLDIKLY